MLINGKNYKDKILIQVKAGANWLQNILEETTGKKFNIKPVILFPGWFIESSGDFNHHNVCVLNPKAFSTIIEKQEDILSKEDMMLVSYHISRFIRLNVN